MGLKEDILKCLCEQDTLNTLEYAGSHGIDHAEVVGAVKSLEHAPEGNLTTQLQEKKETVLLPGGQAIVADGSPEYMFYMAIDAEQGNTRNQLQEAGIFRDFAVAKAVGWVAMGKDGIVKRQAEVASDITKENLAVMVDGDLGASMDAKVLKGYVKRKLLKQVTTKYFLVSKGPNFTAKVKQVLTDLTEDLLRSGAWKDAVFKNYTFVGQPPTSGYLHPLMKVRSQYRQKFLEMGFTEMPTNNFVESSFWNFDSLFQPQQHPARDAHDTFFLKDPKYCRELPAKEYVDVVKKVHQDGGNTGSIGYRYSWSLEESKKNILRTHTTAVSSRMLYKLAQQKEFKPAKYFSIDRVFRNEAMDATHLAEFHQIEGLVADYNLNLRDLIGILNTFFNKVGITNLRFKPAYNPYTEPSMEIFSFHPGLNKWVEIGNSGMFRPEMLEPMGLPKDVTVIAWGLSLERPTMIMYGFNNIRDLFGHKCDLKMIQDLPVCSL